uniref:Serine/threonine-protein kinase 19 n=1 Tax=Mesocestoides corti TaxID=53468 RepID=A0A5K3FBF8_MESCO
MAVQSIPSFESVDEAFDFVYEIFRSFSFTPAMRPVVMRNQLYALVGNRSLVDTELQSSSKYQLLNLFDDEFSIAIVREDDFVKCFESVCSNSENTELIDRFITYLRATHPYLHVEGLSIRASFSDKEISALIHLGALLIKSSDSWWIGFPQLGRFRTAYRSCLQEFKGSLRRARFQELLLCDLLRRKWRQKANLGPLYFVIDQIGAGTITCHETSSGQLIRLESAT